MRELHGKKWMVCLFGYLQAQRVRFGEQINMVKSFKEKGFLSQILLARVGRE